MNKVKSTHEHRYSRKEDFGRTLTALFGLEDSYQDIKRYVDEHGGVEAVKVDVEKLNTLDEFDANKLCTADIQSCTVRYSTGSIDTNISPNNRSTTGRLVLTSTQSPLSSLTDTSHSADSGSKTSNNKNNNKNCVFGNKRTNKGIVDISEPVEFKHISHVGYDGNSGNWQFENVEAQMRELLESIGVTPLVLDDTPELDSCTPDVDDTSSPSQLETTASRVSTSAAGIQPPSASLSPLFPPPPPPPPLPGTPEAAAVVAAAASAATAAAAAAEKDRLTSMRSTADTEILRRHASCPVPRQLSKSRGHFSIQEPEAELRQHSKLTPSLHLMKILELPSCWEKMSSGERHKLVQLQPSSAEFIKVKDLAEATADGKLHGVNKIERVQNIAVYKQFITRKTLMDKLQPSVKNELRLWHGTCESAVQNMVIGGFNRSYCGKNAVKFGKGVYFAAEFSYAGRSTYSPPDSQGSKYVFLSRVLVGEYKQGSEDLIEPPFKDDGTVRYDCVVDSMEDTKIYVIFHDAQAYPEYLVTFY